MHPLAALRRQDAISALLFDPRRRLALGVHRVGRRQRLREIRYGGRKLLRIKAVEHVGEGAVAWRTASEIHEFAQKLLFVPRVARENPLHDDMPDIVDRSAITSISIKSCFVELLLRGSPTPWKMVRNPSISCLQTLLFVVVLTGVCHQEAEIKNKNFLKAKVLNLSLPITNTFKLCINFRVKNPRGYNFLHLYIDAYFRKTSSSLYTVSCAEQIRRAPTNISTSILVS